MKGLILVFQVSLKNRTTGIRPRKIDRLALNSAVYREIRRN